MSKLGFVVVLFSLVSSSLVLAQDGSPVFEPAAGESDASVDPNGPKPEDVESIPEPAAEPAPTPAQAQSAPPPPAYSAEVAVAPAPDRRLLRLRLSEHPIGGSIAMVGIGYPLALIFALGAYYAYHAEDVVDCIADDCASPNRAATITLSVLGVAALTMAIIGTFKLARRIKARTRIRQAFRDGSLTSRGFAIHF